MYGFIYNTLRSLVLDKFGEATWIEICEEAGCPEMLDSIVERHYYDESYLGRVGTVAQNKLGIPLEKILEMFGGAFFEACKKTGHNKMLRSLGHHLYGFLINLDSLHDHLSFSYTKMQAPSFICDRSSTGLILHYYSKRNGLSNIVLGIVKAVSKDYYSLEIDMEMIHYEKLDQDLSHHYIFSITVKEESKDENYLERLVGDEYLLQMITPVSKFKKQQSSLSSFSNEQLNMKTCPMREDDSRSLSNSNEFESLKENLIAAGVADEEQLPTPMLPRISFSRISSRRESIHPLDPSMWPVTQRLFQACFPFHIIFSKDLTIQYMGISLARLFPKAISNGEKLDYHFALHRPARELTYNNIRSSMHNIFILKIKSRVFKRKDGVKNESSGVYFRGQMIVTSSSDNPFILFLGSPRVSSIEELEQQGLYLSDIPVHDVTRDLILLNRHFRIEMDISRELEATKKDLEKQRTIALEEKRRADDLLHAMLPRSVANDLKIRKEVTATDFPNVTILFSDIKGFTNICKRCTPIQVVEMLNRLYTHFDGQLEYNNVYKVETIGDAYMVAAGLLETSSDHATAIVNMAFAMRDEAEKVMDPVDNEPIKIRIGVHSGGVVAGVVGLKMPRYCLFGDSVNTASRMESHGEAGLVHISSSTYNLIKDKMDQYDFYNRGLIEMKGLGFRQTYLVEKVGGKNRDIILKLLATEREANTPDGRSSSNSLQRSQDNTLRNSSFIKLSRCTIVPQPPQNSQPSWPEEEKSHKELSLSKSSKEMSRPVPSSSSIVPISEEKESTSSQANGITAIFISPTPPTMDVDTNTPEDPREQPPPPADTNRKKKCIIC